MRVRWFSVGAWALDAALVVLFVLLGRSSHGEGPGGWVLTLLPFLAALQTGWLLRTGRPPASLVSGGIVGGTTVVLGLLLRVATGDTAAVPFIVLTALILTAFLLGWRGLALLLARVRRRSVPRAPARH
ncbi:MAG: rane protein [Naasia sp.]|nr:rane protein [Naasia sp.]